MKVLSIALFVSLCSAWPAAAGDVRLQFENGYVTLEANEASVGQILAEWARLGHTRIVNAERVVGGPVTLQLTHVPEKQALDVVLRAAAGYMAAPRPAMQAGASVFDRILVMATSTAAPAAAGRMPAAGPNQPAMAVPQPAAMPSGQPFVDDRDDQDEPVQQDVPGMAQPGQPGAGPGIGPTPADPNATGQPNGPVFMPGRSPMPVTPGTQPAVRPYPSPDQAQPEGEGAPPPTPGPTPVAPGVITSPAPGQLPTPPPTQNQKPPA
jgi:hypothetical protein